MPSSLQGCGVALAAAAPSGEKPQSRWVGVDVFKGVGCRISYLRRRQWGSWDHTSSHVHAHKPISVSLRNAQPTPCSLKDWLAYRVKCSRYIPERRVQRSALFMGV